jgi:hypothetical protein
MFGASAAGTVGLTLAMRFLIRSVENGFTWAHD